MLSSLQIAAFDYFAKETDPVTGLTADRDRPGAPASVASIGMALSVYAIGAERGWMTRDEGARRVLATLRFLWALPQGTGALDSGYKGFFYHFLDMKSGERVWDCELSTIDTALLMAGVLTAASYFDDETADEVELRDVADRLYRRVDWRWATNGDALVRLGWKPRRFLPYSWTGYDEAMILLMLGLGSPTHPLPDGSYEAYAASFALSEVEGERYLHAGPLFIHQMSHVWIDFRGIQDRFMRGEGLDYFENSRRATAAQRAYAIRNPMGWDAYGPEIWGISASDGPGSSARMINGRKRQFYDYLARGIPDGPDDGTISPWAAIASLPFAPDLVLPVIRKFYEIGLHHGCPYGFTASFNATFGADNSVPAGWVAPETIGINEGPIVAMIENYRSGFLWDLMRRNGYLVAGLRRAGFRGGWLDESDAGDDDTTGRVMMA